MVNKQDIADTLQVSVGALVDSIRNIHVSGTIDDAAALVVGGAASFGVFRAPYACKVTSCVLRAEIPETAGGTVRVRKAASEVAISNGTDIITTIVPTAAGGLVATKDYNCNVLTASDVNRLAAGDVLGILIADVGELSGLIYDINIERLN